MKYKLKIFELVLCMALAFSLFGCTYFSSDSGKELKPQGENKNMHETESSNKHQKTDVLYSEEVIIKKISELVAVQETAIITIDEELMIETINPADAWLKLEAKHLVADQRVFPVQDYSRTIYEVKKEGSYYLGIVNQSFIFQGDQKESTENRYFMFENGKVYDMGTALEKAMWDNVFAAFPDGEYEFARNLSDVASSYVASLNSMWNMEYISSVSIKIYEDKNTFLYNTKLSMPDWAGGWYESGESIKTYLYETTPETYEYLVRHEATHMLLAAATNDNAAYWMQEGFATTMPEYVTMGKLVINRKSTIKEALDAGKLPSVSEHVNTNIETLTNIFDVRLYYGYSSAMVVYLLEKTDDATLLRLFDELETYPYISLTMGEKVFDTQVITEKCFKKAMGKSFEDFYSGFNSWIITKLS